MKRKIPAMPREMLQIHPKVIPMNNAAYGILNRILDHFWFSDCAPLPATDYQLFMLARAHKPTWRLCRDDIKSVLQDVTPELVKELARYNQRHALLSDLRSRGHIARRARKLEKTIDDPVSIGESYRPKIHQRNRDATVAAPSTKPTKGGFADTTR